MIAYSMMVASHGGTTSGVCTPSMNQNADSSYSRRSSLNTVEYAYRSFHPSAPGGVGISNGLGNRSAMVFLLGTRVPSATIGRRVMRVCQPGSAVTFRFAVSGVQQGPDHAGDRVRGAAGGRPGAAAPHRLGAALQQQDVPGKLVKRPLHVLRAAVMLLRAPRQPGHGQDLLVGQARHGLPRGLDR